MDTPFVVIAVLAGMALVVTAVGWAVTRILDVAFTRAIELATVPDPTSPARSPQPSGELEAIREFLEDQTSPVVDLPYPVIDPTDWSIPEASRPKVARVEPGEGLVPE